MTLTATKRIFLDQQILDEFLHDCEEHNAIKAAEMFFEKNGLIHDDHNLATIFSNAINSQNEIFLPVFGFFNVEVEVKVDPTFCAAYVAIKTPELPAYTAVHRTLNYFVGNDFSFSDSSKFRVYEELRKKIEL